MALSKSQIRDIYRKRAGQYDLSANVYYLIGLREVMRKYFSNVETTEAYGGFVYVAAGEKV